VSNRLREHAGIDAATVQKWTAEHGAAKASEMMGDELLKAAGLDVDDALRLMREDPHKFYQDYGALCASAVLRKGAGAKMAAQAAKDIVGAVPEAQLVEFADEVGFAMMTHFTPDGSAGKILSSGEMMPGSNSGGLIWGTTRYTKKAPTVGQSASFADYGRKAQAPIPVAIPKDILIPPTKALETNVLPKFLNEKAYVIKGLLQSGIGKAAKAPPVAMHGPIHLLPQGVAMTAEEMLAFQGRIAGAINTKAGEKGKKIFLVGLGTAYGVYYYYFEADRGDE
jgi:hypothetical protein